MDDIQKKCRSFNVSNFTSEEERMTAAGKIFSELIYEDVPIPVAFSHSFPYASAREGKRYLNIFSSPDLAAARFTDVSEVDIRLLSVLEIIQATKYAYLMGIDAWVLNEGAEPIVYPLIELLKMFYAFVLKDETLYDRRFTELCSAFLMIQHEAGELVCGEIEDGKWVVKDGSVSIYTSPEAFVTPITKSQLRELPPVKLILRTESEKYEYTPDECAYMRLLTSEDSELYKADDPWRLSDISLKFPSALPMSQKTSDNTPDDLCGSKPEGGTVTKLDSSGESVLGENSSAEKTVGTRKRKNNKQSDNIEAPAGNGNSGKRRALSKFKGKLSLRIAAVVGVLLTLVLICAVMVGQRIRYNKDYTAFCGYIDTRDYGNAYAVYEDRGFGKKGSEYLISAIDKLVLDYAKNRISAEELNASLSALDSFKSVSNEVSAARVTAGKLEESKNSYVYGKNTPDIYTRLSNWQNVIELDEVNYLAVKQNIENSREVYEQTLGEEIRYYSTRSRAYAQRRWQVLQYWYPDSGIVSEWAEEYESESSKPLSIYPISIKNISLIEGKNGYWSLRIDWTNESAKTINSIRFSLAAYDNKEKIVTCSDEHGTWSIFDAIDPGPFGPGEGHDSSSYLWHNAWYGTNIAKTALTGVYIEYKDGTTASFTKEVDLIKIQNP